MTDRTLVVGEALVDVVHRPDGSVEERPGGSPMNVAVGLARLGHPADFATRFGAVVAVSGPVDLLTDGTRVIRVANGDALLTRVTGGGCALGALMAAFLGAARGTDADALEAVAAATLVYTLAAEHAARVADGPGSFAVGLLEALAGIDPTDIAAEARVEQHDAPVEEVAR